MAQLMPLPLTVSCFSKIQIGFTFLVPADPGSPGQRAVKRVCMCVCLGRLGSKLEEMKAKYLRSEAKVRNAHNSYLIALSDANIYQRQYSCVILPALLDAQQHFQEDLVSLWWVCVC